MAAKNQVISGDYKGKSVKVSFGNVKISGLFTDVKLDHETVEEWQVLDEKHKRELGQMIMLGLLAKKKGVYHMSIQFKDGKRSLLEIDDKIYNALMKKIF